MIKFDYGTSPNMMIIGDIDLFDSLNDWRGILYKILQSRNGQKFFVDLALLFENKELAEKSYDLFDRNRKKYETDEIVDIIFVETENGYRVFILENMEKLIEKTIPTHLKKWVIPTYTNIVKPLTVLRKSKEFLMFKEYRKNNKKTSIRISHSYINSIGEPILILKKGFMIKNISILTEDEAKKNLMIKNYFIDDINGIKKECEENKKILFNISEEEKIEKRKKVLKYFYPLTMNKILYEEYLKQEIEDLNKRYEITLIYQAICNLILKYRLEKKKVYFRTWKSLNFLEYLLQSPETFKSFYPEEKYFSLGRIENQIKFQNKNKGEN